MTSFSDLSRRTSFPSVYRPFLYSTPNSSLFFPTHPHSEFCHGSCASCKGRIWHGPFCAVQLLLCLAFKHSIHLETDLVQKISLTFEELQGFTEHAQSSLSARKRKLVYIGVIPSIACMSVQWTCSRLWGEWACLCPRKSLPFHFPPSVWK